jgi:hypothetical protein
MTFVPSFDPLFQVNVDARPSNYLVNHVSWSAPSDQINWSELRLVRNSSGYPQNINDGTLIYSETSDAVVLEVDTVSGTNAVNQFTYTGGGTYVFSSTDGDYITYTAVSQSATSGSGTGAKFDVVRSKSNLGAVISVTLNSSGEGYAAVDTITIPRASIGYDATTNSSAADITVTVSNTSGIQAGIKTFTVVSNPVYTSTTYSQVASLNTSSSGKGATFTLTWDSNSALASPTINSSGSGYKVGDIIRIPGSLIGGKEDTTNLGITNRFHMFDNGAVRTNLAPSVDATKWTAINSATLLNVSGALFGDTAIKVTHTATGVTGISSNVLVTKNTKYVFSAYVRNIGGTQRNMSVSVTWPNGTTTTSNVLQVSSSDKWIRLSTPDNIFAPSSGEATLKVNTSPIGNFETSDLSLVDGILFEESSTLNPYFTGTYRSENPGYGSEGVYLNSPRYYYSLFLKYTVPNDTIPKWKKLGETSSFAIKNNGTLNVLVNHLPAFYTRTYNNSLNSDLSDFLSLFAFHLDTYIAANTSVFEMSNVDEVDEKLMRLMLKQFGASLDDVSGVSQGRVLLSNIIRNYKQSGTNPGIKDFVESYTGYGANIIAGKNILPEYNSSSFVENTGQWFPDASSNGYVTTAPYLPLITYASAVATGTSTIQSYTDYYADVAIDSASSVAYNNTQTPASSIGTTITVPDTSKLLTGMRMKITTTAGTGVLVAGTVITSILSSTTFRVNTAPTTALNTATLIFSTNLISGMGKVINASTSGNVSFTLGPKRAVTVAAATNASVITVKPNIAKVNDYVLSTDYSVVPEETQVIAVSTTGVLTLSKSLTGTLSSASVLTFSPPPAADKRAALTSWISVEPTKPYAFGMYVNAAGGTTKTTVAKITWYNIEGTSVGTAVTGTLPAANQSTNTEWYQAQVSGVAPFNAAYAEPNVTINAVSTTDPYFIDSAFFSGPSTVNFKVLAVETPTSTQSTVTLTTTELHNFPIGNSVSISGLGVPFDGTFVISDSSQDINAGNYLFRYVINSTAYAAVSENAIGYASAVPLKFEEARESKVEISANRVNLCPNPSFEINTSGWVASATGTSIVRSTAITPISGTATLEVSLTSTAPATSNAGYTGTTPSILVISGKTYTFSSYVNLTSGAAGAFDIYISFYDALGTLISSVDGVDSESISTTSGWVRLSTTTIAPNSAYSAKMYIRRTTNLGAAIVYHIDGVLVEAVDSVNYYFDGSFDGQSYENDRDSMWQDTAHYSPSHLYYNRVSNVGRIDTMISNVMYYA